MSAAGFRRRLRRARREFGQYLSGPPARFAFEHRLFNAMLLVIGFFSAIATALMPVLGLEPGIFWTGLVGLGLIAVVYYLSRGRGWFTPAVIWLFVSFVVAAFSAVYYYNAGLDGPGVYMVLMLALIFPMVAPLRHQGGMVAVLGLNLLALLAVEYYLPAWPRPYPGRLARFLDHATAVAYTLGLGLVALRAFKVSYYRERTKTLRQNALLARQRARLAAQTADLQTALALSQARAEFIQALLRELSHRVKNNLQFVSALLSLQAGQATTPATRLALEESRQRLFSIILLHQRLYRDGDNDGDGGDSDPTQALAIALPAYLTELTTGLLDAVPTPAGRPTLHLSCAPDLALPTETVLPLGLILNELLTNALKYAFPASRTVAPQLTCALTRVSAEVLTLTVSDNGVGLPPGLDPLAAPGFGLRLVRLLSRQLDGELACTPAPGGGVVWHLRLPMPDSTTASALFGA